MMLFEYNERSISTKNPQINDFEESIFFQGNGYMGARGYSCEDQSIRPHQKGQYMAGVFDQLKPGITDFVNTPNIFPLTVQIGDQTLETAEITDFKQTLNFADGVMSRNYIAAFGDKHLQVRISRFLSLSDVHTACVRMELIPLDFEGRLEIKASLDASSCNLPINDDQVKKNMETVQYLKLLSSGLKEKGGWMVLETKSTGIRIAEAYEITLSGGTEAVGPVSRTSERCIDYCFSIDVKPGERYAVDKLMVVFTSREVPKDQIETQALKRLSQNVIMGFDRLLEENSAEWSRRWETSDIVITGDKRAQCAVRYNIFQLISNNASDDDRVSIGARGLSHARYKGCYFWDTEIFMLPFFIYTDPSAAKNLLLYRYHTLGAAREHAEKMTLKGARYPWMTSFDGSEQCESWDIGACEVHVTCDIVYAIDQYIRLTGDNQFLQDHAAEIYLETARLWESRFTYDPKHDCYNMLFVKGPDEYCGATQNNTYTNILAVYNLNLALDTLEFLKNSRPEIYMELVNKIDLKESEPSKWREIAQKAVIPYDSERDLYLQDDTFMLLEPLDIQSHKTDNTPLYHKICFDRLQRYQVLKQADLVLLTALLPHYFTEKQKKAIWDFYEPLTLHDSTLSYGIHALLAARLGENDKAWDYLDKGLYLDLENIMNNTGSEGLHLAALGSAWQAIVLGVAGLSFENGKPRVSPNLPDGWEEMCFTVYHQGRELRITARPNEGKAEYLD